MPAGACDYPFARLTAALAQQIINIVVAVADVAVVVGSAERLCLGPASVPAVPVRCAGSLWSVIDGGRLRRCAKVSTFLWLAENTEREQQQQPQQQQQKEA